MKNVTILSSLVVSMLSLGCVDEEMSEFDSEGSALAQADASHEVELTATGGGFSGALPGTWFEIEVYRPPNVSYIVIEITDTHHHNSWQLTVYDNNRQPDGTTPPHNLQRDLDHSEGEILVNGAFQQFEINLNAAGNPSSVTVTY